jgi:hypothetical protein
MLASMIIQNPQPASRLVWYLQPLPPGSRKRHSSRQLESIAKGHFEPLRRPELFLDLESSDVTNFGNHNMNLLGSYPPAVLAGLEGGEIEGIFVINNDEALREELEVQFETLNGNKFSGTITNQEAKFNIFRCCLEFGDIANFV